MKVVLHVPCPPYIRKFVEASFGENIEINQTNWLGIFIYSLLQKKSHPTYHYAGQKKAAGYDDRLVFSFSVHQANKNGYFIINSDEAKIIRHIDDVFRRSVYAQALINKESFGLEFKSTITSILDSYNITENELQYETLKKDFDRVKKSLLSN